jgi:hypothetical protein
MGWSESYWEDVGADWARLQAERRPAGEDTALDQQTGSQPADTPEIQTMRAFTDPAD